MHPIKLFFTLALVVALAGCKSSREIFTRGMSPQHAYNETIPFEFAKKIPIISVTINGKPYRFLFDTGAPMVISAELAELLNPKEITNRIITDSQGKQHKQAYVTLPSLTIGNQKFTNFSAVVIDLKRAPVIGCLRLDGIVGANLMRHAFWKIDYAAKTLQFTNQPHILAPSADALRLPFRAKATYTPVVNLHIDSTEIEAITFDTGSAGGLSVRKTKLPHLPLNNTPIRAAYGYLSSGVFGSQADSAFYFKHNVTIQNSPEKTMIALTSAYSKNLLGNLFFRNYTVFLNWEEETIFLEKKRDLHIDKSISIGPFLQNKTLVVGTLMLQSKAAEMGIAFGDTIIQFNNIDCTETTADEFCTIIETLQDKNTPVQMAIKNKGEITLNWE